jgi:hypothetical protein
MFVYFERNRYEYRLIAPKNKINTLIQLVHFFV